MPWLINAAQLDKFRKNQKNVLIFDASFHLASENRHPKEEFATGHIPGARFLDLTLFHEAHMNVSHMLLRDEARLSETIGAFGITREHKIILYDHSKLYSSCRALWMLKVLGHNPHQLYILDGGMQAWQQYGGKVETGESRAIAAKKYTVNFEARFIRTLLQMKTNLHHPIEQVVDMRHPSRYAGGPEVRLDLRAGHIPGSFSFPYFTMFEKDGRWKPIERIRKQLTGIGVDIAYPIVTMSDSGITSATLNFALDLMGVEAHALYDGSWAEWGAQTLYPGEDSIVERPVITSLEV